MIKLREMLPIERLISKYQCPGCLHEGPNPIECSMYESTGESQCYQRCNNHRLGTVLLPYVGAVALAIPKGFNRAGLLFERGKPEIRSFLPICIFVQGTKRNYDQFNVAVWALEQDGVLFVRCFSPRVNETFVDIVEGGTIADVCPQAIDVGKFIDDMD